MNRTDSQTDSKAAFGVGEWASWSINIQNGCKHDCRYCYAKSMAIRFHRSTPASWCQPSVRREAVEKAYHRMDGRIMIPTSHDITPDNLTESLTVLRKLLTAGNRLLIVSKPHLDCVKAICAELQEFKAQMLFRFSIGSIDNMTLRFWEPGAPSFEERLASLRVAFEQGFATSVSCEPMLDCRIGEVIQAVRHYVTDSIWLGRVNRLRQTLAQNCPGDVEVKRKADQLLAEQTDDYLRELYCYYKDDLRIKFKDSIKKAAGLDRPTEAGLDR